MGWLILDVWWCLWNIFGDYAKAPKRHLISADDLSFHHSLICPETSFASGFALFQVLNVHQHTLSQSPFSHYSRLFLFHHFLLPLLCRFFCCFSSSHTASPETIANARELNKTKITRAKNFRSNNFRVFDSSPGPRKETKRKENAARTSRSQISFSRAIKRFLADQHIFGNKKIMKSSKKNCWN